MTTDILWFSELGLKDLDRVGGKNASLGEMIGQLSRAGIRVCSKACASCSIATSRSASRTDR